MMLLLLSRIALFCQAQTAGIEEKEVLRNEDVIFHQIDEHTWFGTGHLMANESLYLVEGETKAILIDAGTKIKDLLPSRTSRLRWSPRMCIRTIQARLSIISRRFISIRLIR
jgi:hypothetical protein